MYNKILLIQLDEDNTSIKRPNRPLLYNKFNEIVQMILLLQKENLYLLMIV